MANRYNETWFVVSLYVFASRKLSANMSIMSTDYDSVVWGETTWLDGVEKSKFTLEGVEYTYVCDFGIFPADSIGKIRGLHGKVVERLIGGGLTFRAHMGDHYQRDFTNLESALVWIILANRQDINQ